MASMKERERERECFSLNSFIVIWKGVSADADPHYQKLYGRVTDVCGNRRGQPRPSAMQEPRPGRNPSVIRFASPSGKYELKIFPVMSLCGNFCKTCGVCIQVWWE